MSPPKLASPVQVAVCPAALLSVRLSRNKLAPLLLIVMPPFALVTPLPLIVPPVQSNSPLAPTVPEPPSVPTIVRGSTNAGEVLGCMVEGMV